MMSQSPSSQPPPSTTTMSQSPPLKPKLHHQPRHRLLMHVVIMLAIVTITLVRSIGDSRSVLRKLQEDPNDSSYGDSDDSSQEEVEEDELLAPLDGQTIQSKQQVGRSSWKPYFEMEEELLMAKKQRPLSKSSYSRATVIFNQSSLVATSTRRSKQSRQTQSSWFRKRKLCKETCCVENVAISLAQDETKIINTEDGKDLADLMVEDWDPTSHPTPRPTHLKYHARFYTPQAILPCLLPGTIIYLHNDHRSQRQFWHNLRPNITVPYILLVGGSDGNTPDNTLTEFMTDPLLIKVYGTNPAIPTKFWQRQQEHLLALTERNKRHNNKNQNNQNKKGIHSKKIRLLKRQLQQQQTAFTQKFQGIPLGLSQQVGQEQLILPYLERTNYTNPFSLLARGDRFNLTKYPILDFNKDVFIHFGTDGKPHRQRLWDIVCAKDDNDNDEEEEEDRDDNDSNSTSSQEEEEEEEETDSNDNNSTSAEEQEEEEEQQQESASCNKERIYLSLHKIYVGMSQARFGISPPGIGYDCYRTYELLLMGVIPIVEERDDDDEARKMLEGLPIIFMPNMTATPPPSKQEFVHAIEKYIESEEFQSNNFEKGWKKLFLQYNRQQILEAAGRSKEILLQQQQQPPKKKKVNHNAKRPSFPPKYYYQAYHYTVTDPTQDIQQDSFCPGGRKNPTCQFIDSSWLKPGSMTDHEKTTIAGGDPDPNDEEEQEEEGWKTWQAEWENY